MTSFLVESYRYSRTFAHQPGTLSCSCFPWKLSGLGLEFTAGQRIGYLTDSICEIIILLIEIDREHQSPELDAAGS